MFVMAKRVKKELIQRDKLQSLSKSLKSIPEVFVSSEIQELINGTHL